MSDKEFPSYCQLTFEAEGGKLKAVLRPHCPGHDSGVTIGPGYDMKERASADVLADLKAAGVPGDVAEKLSQGVGKKGDVAKAWIKESFKGSDAVITKEASANIFTHVYPGYAELVRKKVAEEWKADWGALPVKMKEILVDLAFRGDLCRFKGKSTKHEKLIKPLVVANDYPGFRKLMLDHRYWQDNTNLKDDKNGGPNGRITARSAWLPAEVDAQPTRDPVSFPVDMRGGGAAPNRERAEAFYRHTEMDHKGGYFPKGTNTVWHGGVHVHAAKGTAVRALWDGKIIAARLAEDPVKAWGHYGSRSFVLLKHDIDGATLNKMALKGKLVGYMVRIASVNLRKTPSDKADIVAKLDMYDELTLLDEKYTSAAGYVWAHVTVKRAKDPTKSAKVGKQGYIAIKPTWYWGMREESKGGKLDDKKIYSFYSLYMHLNNEKLDNANKALEPVAWLRGAAAKGAAPAIDDKILGQLRDGSVVKLDKAVKGGDTLWTSGEYGTRGYRAAMIHWEIFSAENLLPSFTAVEDSDDDFNMDCPQIVKMIQQDDSFWDSDEVLTLDEIVRFYTKHPNAKVLRTYACKFMSEWAINLDVAIPKMLDTNMVSTFGLKERLEPYLWWKEAAGKGVPLPASGKCWHYNPITFAEALARAVPRPVGAAPVEEKKTEEATTSDDHVFVVRNGQRVPHFSQADALWADRTLGDSATLKSKGCAISSVAMVLKYYGRDVSPLVMDKYLDDHAGYSGDSVLWDVAFKCEEKDDLKFGARTTVTSGFKAVLDARIAANKPTIARVDYAKDADGTYNHFVVIVGRHKDGHYIMNDPATSAGSGASNPSNENLIEKTTRKDGYTIVQLDIVDPI